MKNSRLFFLSIIIAAFSLAYYSFKKPDPVGSDNQNSESRSYSLSIDTVRTGTAPLLKIWGCNESDMFFTI